MLNLDVIGVSLTEKFGGTVSFVNEVKHGPKDAISKPESATYLNLRVKPTEDQRVTVSTGERLEKLAGFVTVYPHGGDLPEGSKGIGAMSYTAQQSEYSLPASYHIQVQIPDKQFEGAAARLGRIPSGITVEERGMELPDEFSMKWDTKSSPHLHVAAISFSIPLTPHESEELSPTPYFPPTQSQIRRLSDDVAAVRAVTQDIVGKMKWLIAIAAAFAAIILVVKL